MKTKSNTARRKRRHLRVRKKVTGTPERPRMSVYLSNRNMTVQFIDDVAAVTLAAACTQSKEFTAPGGKNNAETARELGRAAARAAKEKGISVVVFDRGGFAYTGRIKALADAAREEGLQF